MVWGLNDTDAAAARVQVDLLRRASPDRRLELALSLSRSVTILTRAAIARDRPGASESDIGLEFAARAYGQALADEIRAHLAERHP
ncbi:MAG: hypothetical protein R2712_25990 [Vicinamibacterales bacterium]